jgi:hypothetical protein
LIDKDDKVVIKTYLGYTIIQGIIVNLALLNFGFDFKLLTVLSWGSMLWLIEIKLIRFWRRLFYKLPSEPKA